MAPGEDGRLRPPAAGAGDERSEPPSSVAEKILTALHRGCPPVHRQRAVSHVMVDVGVSGDA